VVHDARRCGEHNDTEQTGRQEATNPVLKVVVGQIITRADDTALVDTTVEFDNDLTRSVVINELEFVDVACYWTKTSPSVRAQPAFQSHPRVAIVNP